MKTSIKNQITNVTIPACVEQSLLGWYSEYTKIVGVFHCIKIDRETWIGVVGDGDNGSYEWFIWSYEKFERSAVGYGDDFTALRDILNIEFSKDQIELKNLLLACSKLRLRVIDHAPEITKFSDWDALTAAMQHAEIVIIGNRIIVK